jgi:carbonic anhydrase
MDAAPRLRPLILTCAVVLVSAAIAPAYADGPPPPPWSYGGSTGPAHWASEDPAYATCGVGQRQSPIDIENTERAELPAIEFGYRPVPLIVTDTGFTMQVNVPPGSGGITVGKDHYDLVQFHFHRPSEEKIRGQRYELVVHLLHKSAEGKLAVVAVLFSRGTGNPVLKQVVENMPPPGQKEKAVPGVMLDLAQLLPAARGYYAYEGSLSIPPCTEGVRWFVLKRVMQAKSGEILLFATRYADNARPTQPTNGRKVEETGN